MTAPLPTAQQADAVDTFDVGDVADAVAGLPAAWPVVSPRVARLLADMTLEEKLAQIVGYWLDQNGTVAPLQGEMIVGDTGAGTLADVTRHGIGHYTRVYGTRPVEPAARAAWLWSEQRRLKRETRLGIPAIVHEECLTGLAAWHGAVFPTPLSWGASFDPELVRDMAGAIGNSMHALGVHQGLAPVLDVIRDPRWGRVDECIGEDPYLVGTVGTAYVRGLQDAGVHATLKHFVGYSDSRAGRNHAPVSAGPREIADVFLPPFEMAIAEGGAASVMNAYTALDGVPMAASVEYLTDVLRGGLGFDGVVVADYFSVGFLDLTQGVADDRGHAGQLALEAGVDVELPTGDAYLEPLARRIRAGLMDERYVDRAVLRVLRQKESLGLLDDDAFEGAPPTHIDLDTPHHRRLARRLAEEAIVLLGNNGVLPLRSDTLRRVAVIGPGADRAESLQGCYAFANHVLPQHPGVPLGVDVPTVYEALREALAPGCSVEFALGCEVEGDDTAGLPAAVETASAADVAVVVVGDQAGLFGNGTVGEGNDAESLELPGVQRQLVEAIAATGTPVVLVLLTGRPYAVGWALDGLGPRPAAVVQAFFPGEGGGLALADILIGRVAPSGRLPVTMPRSVGAQPYGYLHARLAETSEVTATPTTPVRPFGFGLTYTRFAYTDLAVPDTCEAGDAFEVAVTVANVGDRAGTDVVQLYGHDVRATVTRPVEQLLAYARIDVAAGEEVRVRFRVPARRLSFVGPDMRRIVEPGDVQLWVAPHAGATGDGRAVGAGSATPRRTMRLTGAIYVVDRGDDRVATSTRSPVRATPAAGGLRTEEP